MTATGPQPMLAANTATTTASLAASAMMPLYEAGAIYSQTRQAEQAVGQRRSQLDDGRRSRRREPASPRSPRRCGRRRSHWRGLQEEALTGTRSVLDMLVQTQQLYTTQQQLVTAEHDAAVAEFNIAAAVGHLIAPELRLPVHLYDRARHYKQVRDKWIGFAGGLKVAGS